MLTLKHYQLASLAALRGFLEAARVSGLESAFARIAPSHGGAIPRYRQIPGLEGVPYVCLRLPTGGGKTLLASHAIQIAARSWLEQDNPLALWLVPSNAIRTQTLEALKNPAHPYRQALDDAFDGRVSVFDIAELEHLRPTDLQSRVCVVVGTLQTLRVDKTEGRDVYAHKEALEPHFARVRPDHPGLEKLDGGAIKFSFANLLHLHRPLVIMDEAHNARTKLTFDTLARVAPACIVEFTATPDTDAQTGSNVLHRVSASELKAEDMIKLPIVLTEHANWQDAVHAALETRAGLAKTAGESDPGIRPLLLLQAENKDKEVNVEVLRAHLIENEGVAAESIAVATGTQRELDGIDLFDPACKVEIILTVQALKEGWDCSFAYVFCSVANIHSAKDVEQLLGRVLRMPFAQRRPVEALNRAYAHVSSPSFADAANGLKDTLVAMGFEETEAQTLIEPQPPLPGTETGGAAPFAPGPLTLSTTAAPDLAALTDAERAQVEITHTPAGAVEIRVSGQVGEELAAKLVNALPKTERASAQKTLATHRQYQTRTPSPAERNEAFAVPRLCLWEQGELQIAERELFLGEAGWNLLDFPAELPGFRFDETAKRFSFDLDGERIIWNVLGESQQQGFVEGFAGLSFNDLVRWLDRQVKQIDVRQETMLEFLRRVLADLADKRGFDLATLLRAKFILAKLLAEKIRQHRADAYAKGYQETLFGPAAAVETSFDYAFRFDPAIYPANWFYSGGFRFQKHFYPTPGELDARGEEYDCAVALDNLKGVKYWVRNLAIQPRASFWLPTSTDRFYPDFVALLEDGRLLVVEYKGAGLATTDDSKEKQAVGELWEQRSGGRGLFVMAEKKNRLGRGVLEQLTAKTGA